MIFRFCPCCAAELDLQMHGDRQRPSCPVCGYVQYRNPTVGVAVVVLDHEKILLGRRAQAGSYGGLWCIPCGHVEWDEDVRRAAIREFSEETGLQVRLGEVIAVHSNVHNPEQQTVGIWFEGTVVGGKLVAGDDLDAVAYCALAAPPPMAFATDERVLAQLHEQGRTPTAQS